jgi:hypothetical protein
MGWLLLAALGIIWAAFLLPVWRSSPNKSVEDFERNMELLADTEGGSQGRWIVTPRKGMAFVGPRERAKERARERRRRVFVFMIELIGLTFLIGLVPPLRAMWYATATLLVLLGVYVWLLLSNRARSASIVRIPPAPSEPEEAAPVPRRHAAHGASHAVRSAAAGLVELDDDPANIVVKRGGRRVGVAGV